MYTEINWDLFLRTIIPFCAANIFAMVLAYFTLVRHRVGPAYAFYATFICCFILFLCGPLINVIPIDETKRWYDIIRSVLLFSIGMPALLFGILLQAEIKISRYVLAIPVILGLSWSIFFLSAPPLHFYSGNKIPWLVFLSTGIQHKHIFYSQIVLVTLQLLIPCLLLLRKNLKTNVVVHIYGVLALCIFIIIGNATRQWVLYYAGSSLTALIWAWAVYQDIQRTNKKIKQHQQHQKSLAIAQYAAPSKTDFTEFYPAKLNEAYPFKEREALLEVVNTASLGLVKQNFYELFTALKTFSQENLDIYRIRAKEILFMLFDSVIYKSGNAASLIGRLEEKGKLVDQSASINEIDSIVLQEAEHLALIEEEIPESLADLALVERIKAFVLSHYDKDISINDVVEKVGASRSHLMKTFKNVTAQTINHYLVEVRIHKAQNLLLSKTVTETAYEVGFNNSAYFSTVFKKQTGMTPKEFQQKAKSAEV
ncbi:AraC family transcriptional regulator [Paraglaciecola sp. L3A3]|uniref:AraC family transcriptional regulator n=1 Tax=Paraglaciecola sp. L3A3 TaxID=2686358 RepID=UPI001E422F0E|nr:AraC family transcriptional regulator [Paraglaciecola sp. L3A3]